MTREEAIQALAGLLSEYCSDCPRIYEEKCDCESQEAIDLAIEALMADVARWSSWNKTFEQSGIADLISRAEVHKTLSLLATEGGTDAKMLLADAHEFIDALPSAELTVQTPQTYGKSINPSNAEVVEDYISRADAIEAVAEEWLSEASAESPYVNDDDIGAYKKLAEELFADIPSADRPQGFRGGKIPPKVNHIEIKVNDRPQGEWIRKEDLQTYWYECSVCGEKPPRNQFGHENHSNYCPNCGAKMENKDGV